MNTFLQYGNHDVIAYNRYIVTVPIVWTLGISGGVVVAVEVPAGFEFDFSSPKLLNKLRIVDPSKPEYRLAAAVHDWLLVNKWANTRATTEFYQALRALSVRKYKAIAFSFAVFVFNALKGR